MSPARGSTGNLPAVLGSGRGPPSSGPMQFAAGRGLRAHRPVDPPRPRPGLGRRLRRQRPGHLPPQDPHPPAPRLSRSPASQRQFCGGGKRFPGFRRLPNRPRLDEGVRPCIPAVRLWKPGWAGRCVPRARGTGAVRSGLPLPARRGLPGGAASGGGALLRLGLRERGAEIRRLGAADARLSSAARSTVPVATAGKSCPAAASESTSPNILRGTATPAGNRCGNSPPQADRDRADARRCALIDLSF